MVAAKAITKKVQQSAPTSELPHLVTASISLVQKKTELAVEALKTCIKNSPSSTIGARLALAQLRIKDGRWKDAVTILEEYMNGALVIDNQKKYQCGLVSLLAWLYGQTGQSEKAVSLMQEAIEFWKSIESGGDMVKKKKARAPTLYIVLPTYPF